MLNKINQFRTLLFALILIFSSAYLAHAAETGKLAIKSGNIRMDGLANKGESSQHDWDATYSKMSLETEFALNSAPKDAAVLFNESPQMKKFILTLDVDDVNTTKSPGFMFKRYYFESMKQGEFKTIVFAASKYSALPDKSDKNRYIVSMTGTLKIAGVEKSIVIDLIAAVSEKTVTISGAKVIDMTDFGIKPPKMDFPKKSYVDSKATLKLYIVAALEKK
jgi:hypothetical protein